MPIFIYKAKRGPEEIVSGKIEADSQDQAVSKLNNTGLVAISVVEEKDRGYLVGPKLKAYQTEKLEAREREARFLKLRSQDVDMLTLQLASLTKTKVPILRALSLIAQHTENRALADVVGYLRDRVKDGRMLSEAMQMYPYIFNNLYLSMIRAGEKGGVLELILYSLLEYRRKEEEIRQKIQAAMAYPLFIIIVGIATVFSMFTFFLPKLIGLYESMKQAIPLSTRILMGISEFASIHWYWFIIGLVFITAIFGRVKSGSKKKLLFDAFKLHLPFVNKFVKKSELSRFIRTLSLLVKSGFSIYESLELAIDTLDNDVLRKHLTQVVKEIVNQGTSLSASLEKIDIFPRFTVNMIAVGEEGGKLQESLNEIANVYDKEIEQTIKIITSLLEPMLILIVGVVVGFIVFSMMLPIFNIGTMAR